MTRTLITIASALALAACGGSAERTEGTAPRGSEATAGAARTAPSPERAASAVEGKPIVTVRVEGPRAVEDRAEGEVRVGATRYEAIVRMQNEGDRPAALELAHVDFEAWSADGQRIACVPIAEQTLGAPPLLQPGEHHSLRALAVCHFPEPGEYEVRSYVSFAAEQPRSDWELARYYAGATPVRVTGG